MIFEEILLYHLQVRDAATWVFTKCFLESFVAGQDYGDGARVFMRDNEKGQCRTTSLVLVSSVGVIAVACGHLWWGSVRQCLILIDIWVIARSWPQSFTYTALAIANDTSHVSRGQAMYDYINAPFTGGLHRPFFKKTKVNVILGILSERPFKHG